jgi:flagellar assembly protein FliH
VTAPFVFEHLEASGDVIGSGSTAVDRAAEIVAEAQARAGEIEAEARRAGHEIGYAEGVANAEAQARATLEALAAAVAAVEGARTEAATLLESRAADLSVLVAERILGETLEARPEHVLSVVGSALRRVVETERLILDVNPDDADRVRAWVSDGGESRLAQLEVRAERRVAPGGCVVRSAEVEIDARVASQLDRARDVVREALAR